MKPNEHSRPEAAVRTVALSLPCHGAAMVGIAELPSNQANTGVVIVVGGPQYRVGSHRQFVTTARAIAAAGLPVLRFDHRGIGDSQGEPRPFYALNDDIRAAIDGLCTAAPAVRRVVLWGLCDGASAALLYANRDPRVAGLVLLNPWLDSPRAQARSVLSHYYRRRLRTGRFWRRLFSGEVRLGAAVRDLLANAYVAFVRGTETDPVTAPGDPVLADTLAFELERFARPTLVLLAEDDLTAAAFRAAVRASPAWSDAMAGLGVSRVEIAGADHSFSRPEWTAEAVQQTLNWLEQFEAPLGLPVVRRGGPTEPS